MRRFSLTLLALLTLLVIQSCGPAPNPLFYAAHKGGETVYLFGSIHAADESFYPLPEKIETAFESSQALAVEVDIRDIDQMKLTKFILTNGMYPQGMTLEQALGEDAEKFKAYCEKEGIPWQQMNPMRPWMAAMFLSQMIIQKTGIDPSQGLDLYFMNKAGDREIISLESMESQLETFSGVPEEVQILSLLEGIEEEKDPVKSLKELTRLWKKGERVPLEENIFESRLEKPELEPYYKALFDVRNIGMEEGIEKALAREEISTLFVVVGAGHLLGDQGLVELMKQKGYEVERL
jgi:hypothetical protein